MADESPVTERLFFALWPTAERQQSWAQAARRWLPDGSGRLVAAGNLHLTLLFAGEVTAAQRLCLERTADAIHTPPFVLRFDHSGYWRRPRVVWFGCSQTPAALQDLALALQTGARRCHLAVDERPYTPHLTLARKVRKPPPPIRPAVAAWPVDHFVLVRSQLTPRGSLYEVVRSWGLVEPPPGLT